jgi:hypothetical protein
MGDEEGIMELDQVAYGQRIRVNVPGLGDHGQVGTVKRVRGNRCYVHLDWDQRPQHRIWLYAADLERVADEPAPAPEQVGDGGNGWS